MATTNHGITVPTVGASTDTWGTEGNLCWTTLDSRTPSLTGFKIDGTTPLPFTGAQCFAVGSAAAPGIQFTGDSNSGLYWIGADSVGISLGGTLRTTFATTGITSTGGFSGTTGTFSSTLSATTGTFTGLVLTPASASGGAGLRLPHGTAPSSPVNGDLWTIASGGSGAGLYARINGSTVGPFATAAGTALLVANNLSDLASASTARTNLGLGTSATVNTGTSGATIPLCNGNNTYGGTMTVTGAATFNGNVTLGNAAGDAITCTGTMTGVDLSGQTIGTGGGASNYVKIGPIYIQWGTVSVTASSSAGTTGEGTVTFPVTFPTALGSITATASQPSGAEGTSNTQNAYINDETTAGCKIGLDSNGGTPTFNVYWIAIGY